MLDGKVALLSGGGGRLGRGSTRALCDAGATVVALDLEPSTVDPGAALALECDVTDPDACAAAVGRVVDRFGRIDLLANLAQDFVLGRSMVELTDDELRRSFESGPVATLRMMQLCHPHLKAAGGGSIINFVSGSGTGGAAGQGAYASAKEAIRGLTKTAAVEWGSDNIRVNALAPFGGEETPSSDMAARAIDATLLRRYGDAQHDIGRAVVYLADAYMTGRTVHVDGGIGIFR